MLCVLEKTVMADLSEPVKSCSPTTRILYLHFHNPNGHQTWQGNDFPWGVASQKATRYFDLAVLRNHATI